MFTNQTSISPQGVVRSVQTLELTAPSFQPVPGTARAWLADYCAFVRSFTWGVIGTRWDASGLAFALLGTPVAALQFGQPALRDSPALVCWALPISGGLLTEAAGGYLAVGARRQGAGRWRLTMLLYGYGPRIAALWPTQLWGRVYMGTQAATHVLVARGYLQRQGDLMAHSAAPAPL